MPEDAGKRTRIDQLGDVVRLVDKNPGATVLAVGLLLLVVGTVSKVGSFELGARASVPVVLAVGGALSLGGGVWLSRARRGVGQQWAGTIAEGAESVALDPEFLLKVFAEAMPPAFVKEVLPDGTSRHIVQSHALLNVQQSPDTTPAPPGGRRSEIKADHATGDERALREGCSRQLEASDTLAGDRERVILTTKTCVRHRGREYVVGWYVPVDLTTDVADHVCLKDEAHQVLYRLAPAKGGKGIRVEVGAALRSLVPAGRR